jgi:deoxyhypusine monooxygenase
MSVQVSPEQLQKLSDCLLNTAGNTPLHERFRALFTLKAVGGDEVVEIVAKGEYPLSTWMYCEDG